MLSILIDKIFDKVAKDMKKSLKEKCLTRKKKSHMKLALYLLY